VIVDNKKVIKDSN